MWVLKSATDYFQFRKQSKKTQKCTLFGFCDHFLGTLACLKQQPAITNALHQQRRQISRDSPPTESHKSRDNGFQQGSHQLASGSVQPKASHRILQPCRGSQHHTSLPFWVQQCSCLSALPAANSSSDHLQVLGLLVSTALTSDGHCGYLSGFGLHQSPQSWSLPKLAQAGRNPASVRTHTWRGAVAHGNKHSTWGKIS